MALVSQITHAKITPLYPTYANDGYDTAGITDMIAAAFETIENRLLEQGQNPKYILETSSVAFNRAHIALTLALIFTTLIVEQGDLWDAKAQTQMSIYEDAINSVHYKLDEDEDDEADDTLVQGGVIEISR